MSNPRMAQWSTLLGIAAAGTSIARTKLIQRFMHDVAGVIVLTITTGFMTGALLLGVFYIAYEGLVRFGLEPLAAQVLMTVIGALTVVLLVSVTSYRMRRLKH